MLKTTQQQNKHIYGFDLIRSLAIIAILLFHIDSTVFSGGFLGVDLFLLLTGYLIAASAFEHLDEPTTLTQFKDSLIRRAKRILPPVIVLVVVILIYMAIFNPTLFSLSLSDGIASLFNVSNWWFIIKKVDYFNSFNTSPFKHLWYLGVTEQFFLIFTGAIHLIKKTTSSPQQRRRYAQLFFLATIIISLTLHLVIYDVDKISRVYYGTDTRIFTPMLGALLASFVPRASLLKEVDTKYKKSISVIAGVGLVIYIFLMITLSEYSLGLYKGGFFAIALLGSVILVSVGKNGSFLEKIYQSRPVQLISTHSYSLYLWHFPILVLTKLPSEVTHPHIIFVIIRLIPIAILTIFSYQWIESKRLDLSLRHHITRDKIAQSFKSKATQKRLSFLTTAIVIMATFSIIGNASKEEVGDDIPIYEQTKDLVVTVSGEDSSSDWTESIASNEESKPDRQPTFNHFTNGAILLLTKSSSNEESISSSIDNSSFITPESQMESQPEESVPSSTAEAVPTTVPYDTVILIGDSLTLGVSGTMQSRIPQLIIDGEVGRQLYYSDEIAWSYSSYDSPTTAIIFQLGTNGIFEEHHLDALVEPFPTSDIYFINSKVPKEWEKSVNQALAHYVTKHPTYKLIDWYTVAGSDPDYLADDLTHVNSSGILAFADLVMKALNGQ